MGLKEAAGSEIGSLTLSAHEADLWLTCVALVSLKHKPWGASLIDDCAAVP